MVNFDKVEETISNNNSPLKYGSQNVIFHGRTGWQWSKPEMKNIYFPVRSERSTGESNIIDDYKSLASSFVEGWKNSPGHYRNIVTPEFNITGVTVSYNPLTQKIFSVQKFGQDDSLDPQAEINDKVPELDSTFVEIFKKPEPSLRNEACIFNGYVTKSIYRSARSPSYSAYAKLLVNELYYVFLYQVYLTGFAAPLFLYKSGTRLPL